MPTPKTPIDLSEYLPDPETAKAMVRGPIKYNTNVDPKLRERLKELKRVQSSPSLPRAAPPSVAEYVPPTEVHAAQPKVELASQRRTQPGLRRLEDVDLPGVVKKTDGRSRPFVTRAVLVVLAVLVPVVLVLVGRGMRKPDPEHVASVSTVAASATASAAPSTVASVAPAVVVTAAPAAVVTAAPAPSAEPSVSATASVARPVGVAPKQRRTSEDPYDAAVTPSPAAQPDPPAPPQPTVTPKAPATVTPQAPSVVLPGGDKLNL
jgi:hypothetical protein